MFTDKYGNEKVFINFDEWGANGAGERSMGLGINLKALVEDKAFIADIKANAIGPKSEVVFNNMWLASGMENLTSMTDKENPLAPKQTIRAVVNQIRLSGYVPQPKSIFMTKAEIENTFNTQDIDESLKDLGTEYDL